MREPLRADFRLLARALGLGALLTSKLVLAQSTTGAPMPGRADNEAVQATARPVVVVTTPIGSTIRAPLRAELEALGLQVVERSPGEDPWPHSGDVITCRIVVNPGSIEVSILDESTGRVSVREIFSQSEKTPVEASTAVLHVVELLRWHLQGTSPSSRAPERPLVAPRSALGPAAPSAKVSRWLLALSPSGLYSPGGTRPGLGASFDLAWVGKSIGVKISATTLFVPNRLKETVGGAEVKATLVSMSLVVPWLYHADGWSLDSGLGLSLVSLKLRGTSEQAYETLSDDYVTWAPEMSLRASQALSRRFRLALSGALLLPKRSDEIYFDERKVGSYGEMLLTFGLGLEAQVN